MNQLVFAASEALKKRFPIQWLYFAALDLIVPGIKKASDFDQFFEISRYCILHQLIRGPSGLKYKLVEPGFPLRADMHMHRLQANRSSSSRV